MWGVSVLRVHSSGKGSARVNLIENTMTLKGAPKRTLAQGGGRTTRPPELPKEPSLSFLHLGEALFSLFRARAPRSRRGSQGRKPGAR